MNTENLQKTFRKMKADVKIVEPGARMRRITEGYSIDVQRGVFLITVPDKDNLNVDIQVLDVDSKDRHVLLNINTKEKVRGRSGNVREVTQKAKWLCGHDERDWFVGAIPGGAKNIWEAKQALKPKEVVEVEANLPKKAKHKRRNKARIRQGEWFFIPTKDLEVPEYMIHKNEPISRGGGSKNHYIDEVYRSGGVTVYVKGISILSKSQFNQLTDKQKVGYQIRTRDASVYARGNVKHVDHATIFLDGWHKVLMNTEANAPGRQSLVFLD